MAAKKLSEKQIRNELARHLQNLKRQGFAPPINTGGRRAWSWAPLLAALAVACAPIQADPPPPATRTCCRYCTNSKACGDGCIPYENACHKAPGCACTVKVHD